MHIHYFTDTDTALVELSTNPPVETRALNENVYIDLDSHGRVVSITIEHAHTAAEMTDFSYRVIPALAPSA